VVATLQVHGENHGAVAMLRLKGEFDMGGEIAFESELDRLLEAEPATLVVDLRGLKFLDSTGLRALIRVRSRARRDGWSLALTRAPRAVERIFSLTRTDGLFHVVSDLDGSSNGNGHDGHWEPPRIEDLDRAEIRRPRFSRRP
jgi:anti-sigma B factor antagonist